MSLATDIRELTVATLIAQQTLAGSAVESDRVDGLDDSDMPRIIVFSQEEAEGAAGPSTAPAFHVTLTLVVQALITRATKADAQADLDAIVDQIKIALLEDPVWNRQAAEIASMRVSRRFDGAADRIVGDGRVEFTLRWREEYQTRVPDVLNGINIRIDAGRPFDATGDYQPSYPVAPPPRPSGPDGRVEINATIDLPTA